MEYKGDYKTNLTDSIKKAISELESTKTIAEGIANIPSDFTSAQGLRNVIAGIKSISLNDINSLIEDSIEGFENAEIKAMENSLNFAKGSELARYEEEKGKAKLARNKEEKTTPKPTVKKHKKGGELAEYEKQKGFEALDRQLEEKKKYIHEKYTNEIKILLEELKAEAEYSYDGSMAGYIQAMNSGDVKRVEEIMDNLISKGKYSATEKEIVTNNCKIRAEFPTYELTEQELRALAAVCFSEQGTRRGAMTEASLMANRFEELWNGECKGETGGKGLYTMVAIPKGETGYWFTQAYLYMDKGVTDYEGNIEPVTDEMVEAVRLVLEDNYRILPKGVNEHDGWGEIKAYNGDTQVDREGCIQFETLIVNDYNSKYIFFGWADPNNPDRDPFGFMIDNTGTNDDIQEAIENIKNQPYFSYEEMEGFFNEEINERVKHKQEE